MRWFAGRPVGVGIVVVLIGVTGLVTLVDAAQLIASSPGDWPASALNVLIGVALVYKAFGLWSFRHVAWLTTLITLGIRVVVSVGEIIQGIATTGTWLSLGLAVVATLYLL